MNNEEANLTNNQGVAASIGYAPSWGAITPTAAYSSPNDTVLYLLGNDRYTGANFVQASQVGNDTRLIIDTILNDELNDIETEIIPYFNLAIPKSVNNISSNVIDPRKSWNTYAEWENKAKELAQLFINNFQKFCDNNHGKKLLASGPQL